jgi:gliding motility-associated lipoprotein GldD
MKSMKNKIRRINRIFGADSLSVLRSPFSILLVCVVCCLSACGEDEDNTIAPKPRAYFRMSFPEKKYVTYDSSCPFRFELPSYAKIENDKGSRTEPCWLNYNIPSLAATIHLTYKTIDGNLAGYLENTYEYVSKHQMKASGIQEEIVQKDSKKVYGIIYNIGGNAASPVQFFLTDSTKHFLRGSLYFYAVPNTDSIQPSLEFIKKDIYKMIETFEWKDVSAIPSSKASK